MAKHKDAIIHLTGTSYTQANEMPLCSLHPIGKMSGHFIISVHDISFSTLKVLSLSSTQTAEQRYESAFVTVGITQPNCWRSTTQNPSQFVSPIQYIHNIHSNDLRIRILFLTWPPPGHRVLLTSDLRLLMGIGGLSGSVSFLL